MKKKILIAISVVIIAGIGSNVLAADTDQTDIQWFFLFMQLFGGLALFLAGLEQLADGLKKVAGNALKTMLSKLTTNRFMGALTGAVVTGILNSSSITTVLVVGFVTAGMMSLTQSVGVIMGANIGSTVTAQLLAFNVSQYGLLPVAAGFFMLFSSKNEKIKHYGMMFMGLGLVFYGMGLMSEAMKPLRDYQPFLDLLMKMENPLLGILAGAVFTGLVQSSAATVGIAIAMASEGLLSLPAGIALALGANIGTCVTALMAALGKPPEAVRAATVHVTFNILGVALWFFFIDDLAAFAATISIGGRGAEAAVAANNVPRQIANANTLFNIVNTLFFLPFAPLFAKLACRLIPEKEKKGVLIEPIYLDDSVLDVPTIALERARQELGRTGEIALEMFEKLEKTISSNDISSLNALLADEEKIDILEQSITSYLGKIRQRSLSESESEEHKALMTTAITLETMADVVEKDLVRLANKARMIDYRSSHETIRLMQQLFLHVVYGVRQMVLVVKGQDDEAATRFFEEEKEVRKLHRDLIIRKSERLGAVEAGALQIARVEVSVADKLTRIFSLAKRIVIENDGIKK